MGSSRRSKALTMLHAAMSAYLLHYMSPYAHGNEWRCMSSGVERVGLTVVTASGVLACSRPAMFRSVWTTTTISSEKYCVAVLPLSQVQRGRALAILHGFLRPRLRTQ